MGLALFLVVLFLVVLAGSFILLDSDAVSPVTTTMESASLPIVMMKTQNGMLFNELSS